MLTVDDAIHGWSPARDRDVEVYVSQDMYIMAINPIAPSTSFPGSVCPPLDAALPRTTSPPPAKSTEVPHTAVAPSSDRRAQRNRNRDPSWIPRPRNAFIIFRCEYSREHAQGTQESQDDQDSTSAVKTLSKRAAEAWKRLSAREKEKYKILADEEREEHARLYPHYRFRPMKRQVSGTRNRSTERSRSPRETTVERNPLQSARLPSVLSSAPKPQPAQSNRRAKVSERMPPTTVVTLPESSSYPVDQPLADPEASLALDYNDPILFYSSPDATLQSDSPLRSASVELYSPLHLPTVNIPLDTFQCSDPAFDLGLNHQDLEEAEDLEAYAIGLYQHELFSPFPLPESF